jgi:hypothetical protein
VESISALYILMHRVDPDAASFAGLIHQPLLSGLWPFPAVLPDPALICVLNDDSVKRRFESGALPVALALKFKRKIGFMVLGDGQDVPQ